MRVSLESRPALVLNADFRPLSYFPLSLWHWQDVIKAVFAEKVNVVQEYDDYVRSPSFSFRLPSVIALKEFIPISRKPAFTRFNVFLRDKFSCQYDGQQYPASELTFDHVVPRAKGGRTTWSNVVTACQKCNLKKGAYLLHETDLKLLNNPKEPTAYQLLQNGRSFPPNYLHESWRDYLYWDTELDA